MQLNFIAGAQRPAGDNPRVNSQICMTPGLLQGGRDVHVTHRCFGIDVGGSAATGPRHSSFTKTEPGTGSRCISNKTRTGWKQVSSSPNMTVSQPSGGKMGRWPMC